MKLIGETNTDFLQGIHLYMPDSFIIEYKMYLNIWNCPYWPFGELKTVSTE